MWDGDSQDINEARERELFGNFFKPALDKGARMVRHHNTVKSAQNIIRKIAKNQPVALRIQRQLVDGRINIIDTAAGKALNQVLNEEIRRHLARLRKIRETIQVLREEDEEAARELEGERERLQEWMEEITKDWEGMSLNYAAELERIEARMKMGQGAQKRERDEANHTHRLWSETNVASRAKSKQRTKRPQELMGVPVTIPPCTLGPQITSHLTSYVHALLSLAIYSG